MPFQYIRGKTAYGYLHSIPYHFTKLMKTKHAKTPLLASLQKAFRLSVLSRNSAAPPAGELIDMQKEALLSRRNFIGNMGKTGISLGLSTLLGSSLTSCKHPLFEDVFHPDDSNKRLDKSHKIAIVGAGIAGLNAAYQLQKQGIRVEIYEAGSTVGGRIRTVKGKIVNGLYSEIGGEFINSDHEDIIGLAQELNLSLVDTFNDNLIKDVLFIDGEQYTMQEAVKDFLPIIPIIEMDQAILEDYESPEFEKLDNISLAEYLEKLPASRKLKKLLKGAYIAEFGLEAEEQSPVYALYTLGTDTSEGIQLLASSDQRYRIEGGNQKLTDRLLGRLTCPVNYEHKLEALVEKGGKYTLHFTNGKQRKADMVILAIPSSILKEVDLQLPQMSGEQRQAIQTMGFGTNAKLLLGFKQPIWRERGLQGYLYGDVIQNGWDHTHLQNGQSGAGYTIFQGGQKGKDISKSYHSPQSQVDYYLPLLEKYFHQQGKYNQQSAIANWPDNPFTKGSYLCPKIGQMKQLELLAQPVGNVLFAGEHTSVDYQGYMNGGAETGRLAAEQVMEKIGLTV
jgi:monoamine oxidase